MGERLKPDASKASMADEVIAGSNPALSARLERDCSEEAPYRGLPTRKRGGALLK